MVLCPVCSFRNPVGVTSCVRCGCAQPVAVEAVRAGANVKQDDSAAFSTVIVRTPSSHKSESESAEQVAPADTKEPGSVLTRALSPFQPLRREDIENEIDATIDAPSVKALAEQIAAENKGPDTDQTLTKEAPLNIHQTPLPQEPKLIVVRGEKLNATYPILLGKNYIGRTTDKPVDIDLEGQEAVDRIWTSRQHAIITYDKSSLILEDLNSLNGTFVNRQRIHPGQPRILQMGDVIQVGTVQLKVVL